MKAHKIETETEIEVVKVTRQAGVTLELSMDEAETLLAVTAFVGGDPRTSRRAHVAALAEALQGAGLAPWHTLTAYVEASGSGGIVFGPREDLA